MTTYQAVYVSKAGITITIHSLTPLPKKKTMRASGGNKSFTRTKYTKTQRKVLIVAKSAKKASKTKDEILDDELENLEDLEDLDDLDDLEDEDVEDLEDEDEDDEDEDESEDDEDEDEDDDESEDLESLTVKDLRARARQEGHSPASIKGLKKDDLIELIESGVEEDDEDDEDEEEPQPKKKATKKTGKAGKSKPSRSRTTDGKVGVQEVADAAGTNPRSLRMVLRKMGVQKDPDVSRYEWSSLNHPEVKKIIKHVKGGAVKRANKESLDKLKKGKQGSKKGGAKRSKKKAA